MPGAEAPGKFARNNARETPGKFTGQYCDERGRRVQLAEDISQGSTIDHSLTFNTWKKVVGDKKKGKLYVRGNLAANYRTDSVASTLRLTLNHGEGTSQQPELTPEMRELIHRLTQEQFTQQMASQAALVQYLINRQRLYEEQLARLTQAQAQDPSHTGVAGLTPGKAPDMFLKRTGVPLTRSAKDCIDQKTLHSIRHNLPGVKPGPLPEAHLPGAKALTFSFAMGIFAGDSAPGKRAFAKAFCIFPGLPPLAKCSESLTRVVGESESIKDK
ncbi:hypothetical protein MTR_1g023240 [Medicago truncatula]|uniref:Uncharacterized protein n=1 Tax=Medicago truncatula TaxID=3880 RepID=G7I5W1_MEDTR|nr:hypothetical protein MTR_1g023240 [Medicago truncatula]